MPDTVQNRKDSLGRQNELLEVSVTFNIHYYLLTYKERFGSSSDGPIHKFPGDFTDGETPDPIPNSVAKPVRPMIVLAAKVGDRQVF